MTLRHYFPDWKNTVSKPLGKKYPTNPQTIGQQLLKRRMDLRLLQKDAAEILQVTEQCIMLWETDQYAPQIQVLTANYDITLSHNATS
jgi:DNA-binding XRE family transcriptional regulator